MHTGGRGKRVDGNTLAPSLCVLCAKVDKATKVKAQEVKQEKGKAINRHRAVRHESSTPAVVKAAGVSAGTATVYAYAQNGVFKKV